MFYLPHTPLILPQLIYFLFLILFFIFNCTVHRPHIDPTWTPHWPYPHLSFFHRYISVVFHHHHHYHHRHHVSIVFPPPPPPPPHFCCFPSTTTTTTATTFLLETLSSFVADEDENDRKSYFTFSSECACLKFRFRFCGVVEDGKCQCFSLWWERK